MRSLFSRREDPYSGLKLSRAVASAVFFGESLGLKYLCFLQSE